MPELTVQDDPNQPQLAKDLLSSIDLHPGLQTTQGPDGQPVMDDASQAAQATAFLENTVPPSGQPAIPTAPAAAPEAPTASPATAQAPATGGRLLAGKYRNVEELERAQINAQQALRERETELRAARAVNQHLEEVFAPLRQPRETQREKPIPISFDSQNQPFVDPNAVLQMIEEKAREIAREQVQESLRPLSQLSQANARLRSEYPEVAQREAEFAQWLSANPDFQQRVTQDPDFYLEGAYLKFERDRGQVVSAQNAQTASAAQGQVSQARAHASPAGGSPVATRRTTEDEAVVGRLNALYKHWQDTGDPQALKAYKNARTAMALGGNFLDVLEKATWGR